ncbi:MAG: hypothetical protein V8Q36_01310 [Anaerotignum sp.]
MKFQRMKDVCLGATVAALVMGAAPAAYAKVASTGYSRHVQQY